MPQMVIDTLALGRKIYWDVLTLEMKDRAKQYPDFVNEFNTTQQFERVFGLTGFGYPQQAVEGSPVASDVRRQMYSKDFYPVIFGISYDWTDVAEYTDQYGKFQENPVLAARSMMQGRELACANLWNNAFSASYTGYDTKALCATDHPTNGGATWSNKPSSNLALGTAALKQAKSEMRTVKDPRNKPMAFTGDVQLIVPPALEVTADVLLASTEIPFTTDRGTNQYKKRVTSYMVVDELTSTTAWWLQAKDKAAHGLFILYGMPLKVEAQRQAVALTTTYVTAETRVTGWKHAYSVWGTPGA